MLTAPAGAEKMRRFRESAYLVTSTEYSAFFGGATEGEKREEGARHATLGAELVIRLVGGSPAWFRWRCKRVGAFLARLGLGLAGDALLAGPSLEQALLERNLAAGELRLQEVVFTAYPLAEFLVEKSTLGHGIHSGIQASKSRKP